MFLNSGISTSVSHAVEQLMQWQVVLHGWLKKTETEREKRASMALGI